MSAHRRANIRNVKILGEALGRGIPMYFSARPGRTAISAKLASVSFLAIVMLAPFLAIDTCPGVVMACCGSVVGVKVAN